MIFHLRTWNLSRPITTLTKPSSTTTSSLASTFRLAESWWEIYKAKTLKCVSIFQMTSWKCRLRRTLKIACKCKNLQVVLQWRRIMLMVAETKNWISIRLVMHSLIRFVFLKNRCYHILLWITKIRKFRHLI